MDISGIRHGDRVPRSSDAPFGELLGDAATHAQGIIRAEVRLGFAQMRLEGRRALRRATLVGAAVGLLMAGTIALMISGAMALSSVLPMWLAVLSTAAVVLLMAGGLLRLAKPRRR